MTSLDTTHPHAPFRHKTVAGLLALLLGWAGAHHRYLGRRLAWVPLLFTVLVVTVAWLREPPILSQLGYYLVLIPFAAGFIEAVVLCVTPDERFDARFNTSHPRRSANRWSAVVLAMIALNVGTGVVVLHIVLASLAMVDGTLGF